jgi:hypothetical protein
MQRMGQGLLGVGAYVVKEMEVKGNKFLKRYEAEGSELRHPDTHRLLCNVDRAAV